MLSTRRFFASILPGLPLAGTVMRSGMNPIPPPIADNPSVAKYAWQEAGVQLGKVAMPPAMKQYMAAQESYHHARHYRYRMRDLMRNRNDYIDPDIMVLKSITLQHKARMQIKRDEDERKQEQSFMSALAESLGLKEFLEKRNTIGQYGAVATEPAPRAY